MRKTVLAILAFFAFFLCSLAVTSGKMERPDVEPHACFAAADYGRLWPIMASPFGGMPRHCHDMLAGFFPDDSIGKTLKDMGLEAGWLIVLLSFLYNVFCALSGCSGTVPYSGLALKKAVSSDDQKKGLNA